MKETKNTPEVEESAPTPTAEEVSLLREQKPALIKVLMDKSITTSSGHPNTYNADKLLQFLARADRNLSLSASSTQLHRLEKAGLWSNQKFALTTQGKNVLVAALRDEQYRDGRFVSEWDEERPKPGTFKKHLIAWEKMLRGGGSFKRYNFLVLAAKRGWFSDGCFAYKLTPDERKAAKLLMRRFETKGHAPPIKEILPNPTAGSLSKVIGYRWARSGPWSVVYMLENAVAKRAMVNADFHDELIGRFPNVQVRLSEPNVGIGYVKGGKTVGIVQPIYSKDGRFCKETIHPRYKGGKGKGREGFFKC